MITDEQIILGLVEHGTVKKTAEALNCSRTTVYNRFQNEDFKKKFSVVQYTIMQNCITTAISDITGVLKTLSDIANDEHSSPIERITASDKYLNHVEKIIDSSKIIEGKYIRANSQDDFWNEKTSEVKFLEV